MREGSWEWYFYDTNPSPLEGVVVWCKVPFCPFVLDFHGTKWRHKTEEDHENYRRLGGYTWFCPKHLAQAQREGEVESEEGDE